MFHNYNAVNFFLLIPHLKHLTQSQSFWNKPLTYINCKRVRAESVLSSQSSGSEVYGL
jgi:hypothetical protein